METVAKEYGHEILGLPPYHCELNPIELAWAAEKNYVAGENKDMSLDSVEKLFRKKREELPEAVWRKCVEHVKKIEENYWESDRIQNNKVEQLIIKLKPTDSSSSEMGSFSERVILQILISLNVNHVFGLSIYFIRVKRSLKYSAFPTSNH